MCPQESISDFYWFYSGKDVLDEQGQRNFSKAINVAKQVFNTLTEYIQVRFRAARLALKGTVHTKMKIQSSFTQPYKPEMLCASSFKETVHPKMKRSHHLLSLTNLRCSVLPHLKRQYTQKMKTHLLILK